MKKVFLTSLSGLPSEFSGGPNKVIYYILNHSNSNKFNFYFLSKNHFFHYKKEEKQILANPLFLKTILFNKLYNSFRLYRTIFSSPFYIKNFFERSTTKIGKCLSNENWDILHSHDIRTLFGLAEKKGKIIQTIHSKGSIVNDMKQIYGDKKSLQEIYKLFTTKEKESIEKIDVLTFPSNAAKELFFNDVRLDSYKINVKIIYNGIDLDYINKLENDNRFENKLNWLDKFDYKILTVGNHIKVKNIDKILFVFHLIKEKRKSSALIIVGSGPLTSCLKKLSYELNVSSSVYFINFLNYDDILRLMKKCNIYISLSERVIFDYVILEALACGMNVFASDDGGNKEIINNYNGLLVDINNLEEVAEIIVNSSLDFSASAKKSVERFDIQNMVNEYLRLYEE